ncbi:MAG: hypothetical protein IPN96_02295 [Anaerolineales bacterium]|nr:hypothetical protein [Anaerolineales bacterium]
MIEAQVEVNYEVIQYQCVPLVLDWLREQNLIDNDPQWGSAAADYHLYLHHNERDGLTRPGAKPPGACGQDLALDIVAR